MHRYNILNFKNNIWFKVHVKHKIQIKYLIHVLNHIFTKFNTLYPCIGSKNVCNISTNVFFVIEDGHMSGRNM
jgi:hypothetical protein